ncbi:hypothetical protein EB796_004437 [Bugula neritina]|uniref:Uncharacterized protein n=1 Tax=Bugula neritina TaxID=10212 RepID=A0A7J7KG69_BUGNE|nr:hypothetical protein EB796_004437 [Bugula neritina]
MAAALQEVTLAAVILPVTAEIVHQTAQMDLTAQMVPTATLPAQMTHPQEEESPNFTANTTRNLTRTLT